jgi:hypothetical protein
MVTMRSLLRPFASLPAMLMLLGALLVVQLSAEAMDGSDEVRSNVRWKNVLSFAIRVLFRSHSLICRTVNTVAPNFG